jgi:hypothetical protein
MLKPSKQTLSLWHREYNSDMLKPSKHPCAIVIMSVLKVSTYHYCTPCAIVIMSVLNNSDMLKPSKQTLSL